MIKRYWMRFTTPSKDFRPIHYPPSEGICGWWCSGYNSSDHAYIFLCVDATSEKEAWKTVMYEWPEAKQDFCEEVAKNFVPGDRFPLTNDWEIERFARGVE